MYLVRDSPHKDIDMWMCVYSVTNLKLFLSFYLSVCLSFSFLLNLKQGISWRGDSGNPIFSYQQWQTSGNSRGARPAGKPFGCRCCVCGPWHRARSPSPPCNPGALNLLSHCFYVWHKCHSLVSDFSSHSYCVEMSHEIIVISCAFEAKSQLCNWKATFVISIHIKL